MRESSATRWCTGTRRTPEWRTRLTLGIDKFKKLQVLLRKHVVDARRAPRASHLSKGYSHLRSMVPGSRDNLTGLFDTAVHCVLLRSTLFEHILVWRPTNSFRAISPRIYCPSTFILLRLVSDAAISSANPTIATSFHTYQVP